MSIDATDATRPIPSRFDVTPHVSDGGGGSIAGSLQLISILGSVGILAGLLVSFISQWMYLIVLFPLGMGAAIGIVGSLTIERYRIRKPFVCGLAGFAAGSLCMLAMHYSDYQRFESQIAAQVHETYREIARDLDHPERLQARIAAIDANPSIPDEKREQVKKEIAEFVRDMLTRPQARAALQVNGFWSYMDFQAQQGVSFSKLGREGKGENLGYEGTIIYWIVESLIVAGVAYALMSKAAAKPFCLQCNSWKTELHLLQTRIDSKVVAQPVREGDLTGLEQTLTNPNATVAKSNQHTNIIMDVCCNCESAAPFEVKVVGVKVTGKSDGKTKDTKIVHMTYPGEALEPLKAIVTRLATTAGQ